ncbi:lipase 1 [Drosophila sulfurigaster albostrigata]|uniref:lipase 1 n=1 Tax=Drosophila sulfurigaster albostrigata TaxID=89887 RepID=UPI002D21E605|nr:lipase 1 [Drosophila sulfurigaster albostrigata]
MREFVRLMRCSTFGAAAIVIVISLTCAPAEERNKWTTLDWLRQLNYTHELHNVTTDDGYQLQLQRLPQVGARPVLLVHGLLSSSVGWLCLGPDRSLAFQLHQRKYDVWLANLRGMSPYGRHHLELTDVMSEFWRYSFHEHGAYDLPAIIDHIVALQAREKHDDVANEEEQKAKQSLAAHRVLLIGHSQAFNAFLVLCALHPRFNQHIQLIQALAPLARLHRQVRFDHTHVRDIMKFVKKRQKANKYELFPPGELKRMCRKKKELCEYYTKNLVGSAQSNKKLLDIFNYDHLLQGGSAKELRHLQQIWKSGDFIAYDYGPIENMQVYHGVEALSYNLSQISVPIILYFGETDAIATPQGVHDIYAHMLSTVRSVRRIAATKFNHFDFLLSSEVKTLVNDKLIELMEKFLEGNLPYVIE